MPNTYFDSELTGEQIEAALTAIDGVVTQENNGKVLAIEAGKIVAKNASEWTDTPVLEPLSVTANGDYVPGSGVDGFSAVHVAVSGGGGGTIEPLSVTQNGTYTPPSGVDGYAPVTVQVSGSGGIVLSGTESPTSSLGSDEELYVQYQIMSEEFNHTYKVLNIYRKESGVWVDYSEPINTHSFAHIWTKSTSGSDAELYIRTSEMSEPISLAYRGANYAITIGGVEYVRVKYPYANANWYIENTGPYVITESHSGNVYTDQYVAYWLYSSSVDIYLYTNI